MERLKQLLNLINIFNGPSYNNHQGNPSMGRKWLAFLMLAFVGYVYLGTILAAKLDPKVATATLGYYQAGLASFAAVISAVGLWVYGGKAAAQTAEAKAKTSALVAAGAITPPPASAAPSTAPTTTPATQAPTTPPNTATAKATTATDTSTKAGGAQ